VQSVEHHTAAASAALYAGGEGDGSGQDSRASHDRPGRSGVEA
jgi:hypothetical protein